MKLERAGRLVYAGRGCFFPHPICVLLEASHPAMSVMNTVASIEFRCIAHTYCIRCALTGACSVVAPGELNSRNNHNLLINEFQLKVKLK